MPYSLAARNVLVTGGSRGLGAMICEKFAAEGCNIAINYNASPDRARKVASAVEKMGRKAIMVQGDMCLMSDCKKVVQESIKQLGGLDILIHNAGWTKMCEFGDLHALTEEDWDKCWDINTKANVFLLREAMPTFNANPDGGVFLITSSVAGTAPAGSSMAYSTSKAAGLHLMQCLAQTQGPKVRVNAILPGLLMTEWGQNFDEKKIQKTKDAAALKDVTGLEDCVDAFVATAKNSSMTGVKVRVDAGFMIR